MQQSRLTRNQEKQAIITIILIIAGTIVILSGLVFFGIPFLINLSLSMEKTSSNQTNSSDSLSYIAPPTLNPMVSATNSANVTISGFALKNQSVELFVNNKLADKTNIKNDGTFTFDNIILQSGKNEIKGKTMIDDKKESDFSDPLTITYENKAPTLNIDSPQDNQSFSKDQNTISVKGTTDAGDKVTVNGFWSIVDDQGKFLYIMKLQNGDNQIKIIATDDAGNNAEKDIKVTYSP